MRNFKPISVCPASAQKTYGRITRRAEVFCRCQVLEGQTRNFNKEENK